MWEDKKKKKGKKNVEQEIIYLRIQKYSRKKEDQELEWITVIDSDVHTLQAAIS